MHNDFYVILFLWLVYFLGVNGCPFQIFHGLSQSKELLYGCQLFQSQHPFATILLFTLGVGCNNLSVSLHFELIIVIVCDNVTTRLTEREVFELYE